MAAAVQAYQACHADDKFTSFVEPARGHVLSPAMWERIKFFFEKDLKA